MGEKDEFYEFMKKLAREKELRQKDREFIESASRSKKTRHFDEQEEIVRRKRRGNKTYKVKSKALMFLLVLGFVTGVGAKATYDAVAPIVKVYVQNQADSISLSGWQENFSTSKAGYFLDMEVKREHNSIFNDGPVPFDYDDPENLSVTADGEKVGAIVDYFDAFDRYLESSTGTGYYETKYEQMQRLVSIGKDPDSIDCIYSYDELSEMFSNDKGLGVKQ